MVAILRLVVLLIVFAVPQFSLAGAFTDGNELYNQCTGSADLYAAYCLGYVTGVSDALTGDIVVTDNRYCPPRGLTVAQIKDVAVKFLRENPGTRNATASSVVAHALQSAFPCR
jgi:Rap1a immunity proteins